MADISAFIDMGGYGGFIWPAYLIVAAVLAGLLAASLRSLRSTEDALKSLEEAASGNAGPENG